MKRACWAGAAVALALASTGCSSLLAEGGAAGAGIVGGALASAVTDNAGVAAGIGIGVQAATRAGIQYGQRKIHGEAQQQIARVAGPLKVGQVQPWQTVHALPLEPEEAGRVAVSRVISTGELDCKEIVFSVDRSAGEKLPSSAFYIASICRSSGRWDWASAEPATARWGALQ
ncbi:hypothetical protein [Variovorax guangxiensis]|uniref:Lipoprotein n=1 Tax=Variovorax guangxiensis TaxID=1775474 RepID=A0A502DQL4_9BURK|nr:hypothetical protein [Variovorax guangxiensis]TPG23075.1 hypothetical protein EAH83_13025 [Variovorax ginsengisoli]TPG27623.1 hypothetical protein EAH82_12685 [Variovorax guangxiensis]